MKSGIPQGPVFELRPRAPKTARQRIVAGEYIATGAWRWERSLLEDFEIIMVVRGSARYEIEDRAHDVSTGGLVFLMPRAPVKITKTSKGDASFRFCHFNLARGSLGRRWDSWRDAVGGIPLFHPEVSPSYGTSLFIPEHLTPSQAPGVLEHHAAILQLQERKPRGHMCEAWGRLLALLSTVSHRFLDDMHRSFDGEDHRVTKPVRHVDRALRFIKGHLNDPISPGDVADALRLGADYLGRVVRSATGLTIGEHIHVLKIESAKTRLIAGEQTVKEIAAALGFSDQRYFATLFRRYVGLTPSAYARTRLGVAPG